MNTKASATLGVLIIVSMFVLGYLLGSSVIEFKSFERSVSVKGLAEKEVKADLALWPIVYLHAENDLGALYAKLERDTEQIIEFLKNAGFEESEISIAAPSVVDKMAQGYGGTQNIKYRYSATQTLTLYTQKVDKVRESMTAIAKLGKLGITFRTNTYENKTEFIYSKLNEIKPAMIEAATSNARAAAQKFAEDSQSSLGKIKSARQGQFSIRSRDTYTPYLKKVRVVSTIEYYLND